MPHGLSPASSSATGEISNRDNDAKSHSDITDDQVRSLSKESSDQKNNDEDLDEVNVGDDASIPDRNEVKVLPQTNENSKNLNSGAEASNDKASVPYKFEQRDEKKEN